MNRFVPPVLLISLLASSTGCGNVFISDAATSGSTMTGSINFVQLGNVVNGSGGTVQVTFVTFAQNGLSSTIGFCDDQTSLFPLDQTLRVNFNPGRPCATIIVVVIIV